MSLERLSTQALVIGSGVAGCTTAFVLAEQGFQVTLITAGDELTRGNTVLAQGGIVYRGDTDSPNELERDILIAGWRHNYAKAVRHLAEKGPDAVSTVLIDRLGIPFATHEDGSFYLAREGGHSQARILHCADYTGKAIMEGLERAVQASPNIQVLRKRTAVDLLTTHHHATHLDFKYSLNNQCAGAYVLDQDSGQVQTILADFTVLATGGCGQIFLHTTNSRGSIGSALAMGYRAGVKLMNVEYVQFHPTALFKRAERRFLISEAVRGEGARLVNADGQPFMQRYDKRGDLAPRDIVTRAIMEEMLRTGEDSVYLDAANYVDVDVAERFPTIFEKCKEAGIDIRRDPIPVVPAAHYFCGGLLTDLNGRTTLDRLYAVGECACTGVHGANRLASTSLLEGLLWGKQAGEEIGRRLHKRSLLNNKLKSSIPDWNPLGNQANEDPALIAQDWAFIRNTMWNYVGISRTTVRLRRAFEELRDLNKHLHDFYKETPISKPIVDLFHGSLAAYLITTQAMRNKQSLGCHHRKD